MKTKLGLTILSAVCIGLAMLGGCMGVDRDEQAENRATDAKRLQFINETSASLAKSAVGPVAPDFDALGCPKLGSLFKDMVSDQGTESQPFPQSFKEYLSCFGFSGNGKPDDIDVFWEKIQNPTELLDCICGGSALSDLLAGKLEVFSASASVAAGAAFNATQSSAAGSAFNASSSTAAGSAFNGSQSNSAGQPFSAD
jgi:hypothetical protein